MKYYTGKFLLFTFFCSQMWVHADNLIQSMHIDRNHLKISVNQNLKLRFLRDDFFAEYDEDIDLNALDSSLVTMPFVLNVLPIVWISNRDYSIDSMDEDLYHSLEKIKKVYERLYPKTSWTGNLIPRKLVKNKPLVSLKDSKDHIALLYSGGLDSLCASLMHMGQHQLLITAWGQWDVPLERGEIWQVRKRALLSMRKNTALAMLS